MKSRTKLVQSILIIILIIAILAVPVAAMTINGDATVDNSDQTTVTANSVTIEKHVDAQLNNNAEVKDATSNGPMGPETSLDGTISVELTADITANGKTTGTGSATLNGTVIVQGSHDADNTSAVINTSVTSSVTLNSGTKGTAEGKVNSSGSASATYNGTELQSNVSGTSSACGKTQSASIGILNASGGISSESLFTPVNNSVITSIFSDLNGYNTSSGSASASGDAHASADNGNVTASVTGATNARGSGSGLGAFSSFALILSQATDPVRDIKVESDMESLSGVESGPGKYTATASSSASTSIDKENSAHVAMDSVSDPLQLDVNTTGTAMSGAAICGGTGSAFGGARINAQSGNSLIYNLNMNIGDMASLGISFAPELADWSYLTSSAEVTGSKTSASGSTSGKAAAMAALDIPPYKSLTLNWSSNTSADGNTMANVNVKGTGEANAESTITSVDLLGVDHGSLGLVFNNPIPGDLTLPDIPKLPEIPLEQVQGLPQIQLDQNFMDLLTPDVNLPQLEQPIMIQLPGMQVLELSMISQSVSAVGCDKAKVKAEASADGETSADGLVSETHDFGASSITSGAIGSSDAAGSVAGSAGTEAKCDHDPGSASVILGVSAQGIGLTPSDPSGLDATLIASYSGAGGSSGKTSGTASGSANASGGFGLPTGPSSSSGTVNTTATANGGLGLSTAAIGSADYTTFDGLEGSLVDVALIGAGSFASGTAGAHADANGQTEANGSVLHEGLSGIDEQLIPYLNLTSDAFASGMASSDVTTKNGIALAADAILAGEGTSAGGIISAIAPFGVDIFQDDNDLGSGIAGSTISQFAFAQQFCKSGSAKANTYAEGGAGTSSTFYVDLGEGAGDLDSARMYISGEGTTDAAGTVSGSANAGCGDPLSVSTIMAFTEFGGDGSLYITDGTEFVGTGDAYNAALIGSLSASWGKSADTWGIADGTASSDSSLEVNTSSEAPDSLYMWNSASDADAKVKTTASTSNMEGFALGVAAQGASSEVDASLGIAGGSVEEHAITLDGALSLASGDGKATADVNKMEQICKDKKGKVIGFTLVPSDGRDATALAQFTGNIDLDPAIEVNITSSSFSGSTASSSAEAAKGGFALSLAGEASGALTNLSTGGETSPIVDQDVFSVIADLATAETDCSKETAKAAASADGNTNALSFGEVPVSQGISKWNGTQTSNAAGSVSAHAVGGDKCKDPLSASLILALGDNTVSPDIYPILPVMDTSDKTLITSLSLTNGSKGDAGATACGSANADGVQNALNYMDGVYTMNPTSSASTEASVWSHAAGNNGLGLGIAGVGSLSEAHFDYNLESVKDENLMFSYATAQGFGKKATADAGAGYDAAHTASSASNVFDRDLAIAKVASTSSVAGKGESFVQASDLSKAQALSFGWAGQNASVNFTVAFDMSDPANASHADAMVLFGTEANATNDAKNTLAKANMSQVNLAANASAGFADFSIPEENALAKVNDGNSHVLIDPDGGTFKNGFIDIDTSNNVGAYEGSVNTLYGSFKYGRIIPASTATDPNYGYTHGGVWANTDISPPPNPFPPYDFILPMIPV
jgi:hypothetical protein